MTAATTATARQEDQRILLHGVQWADYERLLAMRGESSGVRISYWRGEVELKSPSTHHEWIKKSIARLLEAWSDEREVDLTGYGSWTVKDEQLRAGLEPDECYVLGSETKERPDLAIEVVWTSGGIGKLGLYQELGVPEVWYWRNGRIEVHVRRDGTYVLSSHSEILPDLDLAQLARFVERPSQPQAVRDYRKALRGT